jgi:pyruvate formate lyase activating enzyme
MEFCGLVKTSTLDFPGKIAAVLFSPGCNWDCFYCQNRSILRGGGARLDPSEVTGFLQRRRGLLEGVVLTGGEATLQRDIVNFARTLKKMGYSVKLDTNGSRPGVVRDLLKKNLLSYVALDYKAPWGRYPEICGEAADPKSVIETLSWLLKAGVRFETRTTAIPQLSEKELISMARAIPPVPAFVLQDYRQPGEYKEEDRFRVSQKSRGQQFLAAAAEEIRAYQPGAEVR